MISPAANLFWMAAVLSAMFVSSVRADGEADEASWVLDCSNNLVVNPPKDKNIHFGDDGKLTFNLTTGDIQSEQMATITTESARQAAEIVRQADEIVTTGDIQSKQMATITTESTRQAAEIVRQADEIVTLKADALLNAAESKRQAAEIVTLKKSAAADESTEASTLVNTEAIAALVALVTTQSEDITTLKEKVAGFELSNAVYSDELHPGGDLDFTPGSPSLAALEKTLVGAKVFLNSITIRGSRIKGSVVSRLLKNVTTIGGAVYCHQDKASFEVGDSELVFESLASVRQISMYDNDGDWGFTGVSFPVLTFVPEAVILHSNPMLETISMPNLVAVAGSGSDVRNNPALTSVHLPSHVHLGGELNFTPGSASLAVLEKTLVGVKVFLTDIFIKGDNIQGSVVSRLLKDVTTICGVLDCEVRAASFAVGDADLVFVSLATVRRISMGENNDAKQRFTGASFPVLTHVSDAVNLHGNDMLETISMPNLVGIGRVAYFYGNSALTLLQLPSLVVVGSHFMIYNNPSLTTDKVQVSKDFEFVGGTFRAYNLKAGFQCTLENGLRAVVALATGTDTANLATCKK